MRKILLYSLLSVLMAGPLSAQDSTVVSHGATVDITAHSECRRITNNHASGSSIMVPTKTAAEWSTGANAFINAPPPGVTVAACGCAVTPGSQSFTTAGSHNFTVPCHNNLTVEVWGGGGGGGGTTGINVATAGSAGGVSRWNNTDLVANGGQPSTGCDGSCGVNAPGGAGGTASGGTTNLTGQNGLSGSPGKGGDGANGGAGGAALGSTNLPGNPGTAPGGGGGGGKQGGRHPAQGGGGGGGGYSSRAYSAGTYSVGSSIPVVVGAGGTRGGGSYIGGNGAEGRVTITWN